MAVIVALALEVTGVEARLKVAVVEPPGTVTYGGTFATVELLD